MRAKAIVLSALTLSSALFSATSNAEEGWKFRMSSGVPHFITPEASYYDAESGRRYYGNIKIGADNGASVGVDFPVSANQKHSMGFVLGSVGVRDGDTVCREEDPNNLGEVLGSIIGCGIAGAFDWENVNGVGVSYSYNFNKFGQSGWYTRFEYGYGKGQDTDRNLGAGSFFVGYEF